MKSRLRPYLLIAVLLALALSTGSYANAFITGTGVLNISEPAGDLATSNTTVSQPDWSSVLNDVTDTENFRPDSAGNETGIESQYPDLDEHWDKVADVTSDDDATYIETSSNAWVEDLFNITDLDTQTAGGTINYVRVYIVARATANSTQTNAYVHIKTNGLEDNGPTENLTTSYVTYSNQWNVNPQTDSAWTWSEIDALQVGVGLRRPVVGEYARCTQVWAEVSFDAPPLTGSASTGDLFTFTADGTYSGDLAVKVYLLNTDNLTKAYQQLNMQLYLEGSVEATLIPNYRVLNIQNGFASFWIDGGASGNKTLSITGGDYTLFSRDVAEWQSDYTVTPDMFIEVTQR